MLPLCATPLASPLGGPCDLNAQVFRDPHINFAYGGSADLRGRHNALYSFLSAPDISVNVKTEDAVFKMHGGALTINGSFLTEAHVTARLSPQKLATASFWASELDSNNFGWQTVNGTCVGRPFKFGSRGHKTCFDMKMSMDYSSATFVFQNWTMTVHGTRSCKGCLIVGPEHRLDIGFSARGDPSRDKPHGIIGQSYATPGRVRHGNKDIYPWTGTYTTRAQAEGAIEGTVSDYEVASAHATDFPFSRFNAARGAPTSAEATDVVDASSIDRVADPATEAERRRLSEAPCPPPSAGGGSAVAAPPPPAPAPTPPPAEPGSYAEGVLASRNGANGGLWKFMRVKAEHLRGTSYGINDSAIMVEECAKVGMKPLCDHPYYCGSSAIDQTVTVGQSVYLGQLGASEISGHMSQMGCRCWDDIKMSFPKGFEDIRMQLEEMGPFCTFTAGHTRWGPRGKSGGGPNQSLCVGPYPPPESDYYGFHWASVRDEPSILCAKEPPYKHDDPFEMELGAKNDNVPGLWTFQRIRTMETSGNFDEIMIDECAKVNMKPLCDDQQYCKTDPQSYYMGQDRGIVNNMHRAINSYFPEGWDRPGPATTLKQFFEESNTYCTYTAKNWDEKAICTLDDGGNVVHGLQVGYGYRHIMCARQPSA